MNHPTLPRTCLHCKNPIKGRTDKKFCDDYCRSTYNNSLNGASNRVIRNINNKLRRNRRILEQLLGSSRRSRTEKNRLFEMGFDPGYHTHMGKARNGVTCYFCYDFGLLPSDEDHITIIRMGDQQVTETVADF